MPTARSSQTAAATGGEAINIDGRSVVPGASGLGAGAVRNGLPASVIIALALLALGGGALAVPAVRRGIPRLPRRLVGS